MEEIIGDIGELKKQETKKELTQDLATKQDIRIIEAQMKGLETEIKRVEDTLRAEIRRLFVGKELELLVDGFDEEFGYVPVGRIYAQAPEVDGITYVEAQRELKAGDVIRVRITQVGEYDLGGEEV